MCKNKFTFVFPLAEICWQHYK